MNLSNEMIKHLGLLSKLELNEDDIKDVQGKLESILQYIERIQEINTDNVSPFTVSLREDWRKDESFDTDDLTRDLILENFPDRISDLLNTPGVFKNNE